MKPTRPRFRIAWLLTAGLAGCAAEVPLGEPDLNDADIQARAGQLEARLTTRERAHELLGSPWLASERYGVEVYRAQDTQHKMLLVFAPYPVPVPMPGNKFEAYTLVSYAPDGRVAGVEAALGQSGLSSPGPLYVRAHADGVEFIRDRETTLAIPLTRFLEHRVTDVASACTVLVSCAPGQLCWNRVQVDRGSTRTLPITRQMPPIGSVGEPKADAEAATTAAAESCGDVPMLPGIGRFIATDDLTHRRWVPLELPAGRHTLAFTSRWNTAEARGELDCQPGQLVYATLSGKVLAMLTLAQQLQHGLKLYDAVAEVAFSSEPPDGPAVDRVVIHYEDEWLVGDAR
jgi:hypothetical protein